MKHKLFALLAAGLMLTMTGCSLAREPAAGNNAESGDGDRFVGVYVVRDGRDAILDRTNWVDYGSVAADTESPGPLSAGMLSPVSAASFTALLPSSTTPSTGTLSPGRTTNASPICTCAISTVSSLPSM